MTVHQGGLSTMRRLFSLTSGRILLSVVFQTLVAAPAFAD